MNYTQKVVELFRFTGITNPTEKQIQRVLDLSNGNIGNGDAQEKSLREGIQAANELPRWRGIEDMKTQDTVGDHQRRVHDMISLSQSFIQDIGIEIDFTRACFMAKNHDMTEGLSPFGDIPSPIKQQIFGESLKLLKRVDYACLIILSNIDHNLGISKDAIMDIFLEMEDKKTQEAQLVKYFDLLDAYMMSVHEHLFGTVEFLERFEWYRNIFKKIHRGEYLPFLQKILLAHQQNGSTQSIRYFFNTQNLSTLHSDPTILENEGAYLLWRDSFLQK